jgi:hypothetical protein
MIVMSSAARLKKIVVPTAPLSGSCVTIGVGLSVGILIAVGIGVLVGAVVMVGVGLGIGVWVDAGWPIGAEVGTRVGIVVGVSSTIFGSIVGSTVGTPEICSQSNDEAHEFVPAPGTSTHNPNRHSRCVPPAGVVVGAVVAWTEGVGVEVTCDTPVGLARKKKYQPAKPARRIKTNIMPMMRGAFGLLRRAGGVSGFSFFISGGAGGGGGGVTGSGGIGLVPGSGFNGWGVC